MEFEPQAAETESNPDAWNTGAAEAGVESNIGRELEGNEFGKVYDGYRKQCLDWMTLLLHQEEMRNNMSSFA